MVLAKSKKSVGLGNQLMKDRFGKGKGTDQRRGNAVTRINHATGEQYVTNDKEEASWVKMRSVTEQGALDEFLATAELANTDFTAEKTNNVQIIHPSQQNRFLLSSTQEKAVRSKHKQLKHKLEVPRRPKWDKTTTATELDMLEREAFLEWRRNLAELDEVEDLLLTPFERNLEVWRQLWRVVERSDIVVQIVDARNPLLFRSEDLEDYVTTIDLKKKNLMLINKSDMLTERQRKIWAKYLKEHDIEYRFFSAALAKEENEKSEEDSDTEGEEEESESEAEAPVAETVEGSIPQASKKVLQDLLVESSIAGEPETRTPEVADVDIGILTIDELQEMFLTLAPARDYSERKLAVGLVGYPNVGKSSTINALCGAKKVSVSATPGKTKHFQTIHISDDVVLCDCPGLVFPNFAATKAELVCNGILPIDQMREYIGPVGLVAQRLPKAYLEAVYGIKITTRPLEEGGSGVPAAHELLDAYARARGFYTTGHGTSDESRAARLVLKDYVSGKLLYCEPPPGEEDPSDFNRELYTLNNIPARRRAEILNALGALSVEDADMVTLSEASIRQKGDKSNRLDKDFFGPGGSASHVNRPFNHKYSEQGKQLSSKKAWQLSTLEQNTDLKDIRLSGKKHYKGNTKGKKKALRNAED
ncbi:uncharacterized protein MKZ38_004080 [Zalerion maritima]|uniref:CP-type G domain-containing protein n=1 Tax=Zalerion maritima TaxID=339359 RepID=A0AAD5WV33_9PEZI|nr:uncharacterized protein MKZ38_004080 [Zalerion maritima]